MTLFPAYRELSFPDRQLSFLDGQGIYSQKGKRLAGVSTFLDLANSLFDENLQLWVDRLLSFRWLRDTMDYGEVLCERNGPPKCAFVAGPRNTRRWIVQAPSWGYKHVGQAALQSLQSLFGLCRAGIRQTAGSLGAALMRRLFPWGAKRHGVPPADCRRALHRFGTGGRAELFQVVQDSQVWELDRRLAYPDEAGEGMPAGTADTIAGPPSARYATWYCLCTVTVSSQLDISPFAMRGEDENVSYPRAPGRYQAWLWKHQYESCLEAGLTVSVQHGWGWLQLSQDLAPWRRFLGWLRPRHELAKSCGVQAIGKFNMGPYRYLLVPEVLDEADWPILDRDGRFLDCYGHREPDNRVWQGAHWYYYNASKVADGVYRLARRLQKWLVAINFDAVYVTRDCPLVAEFKPKSDCKTGEVGKTLYDTASLLKNRWFWGRNTSTGELVDHRPGLSRDSRPPVFLSDLPAGDLAAPVETQPEDIQGRAQVPVLPQVQADQAGLTVGAACALFKRCRSTIYRWLKAGKLQGIKIKGRWVIAPQMGTLHSMSSKEKRA